MRLVAPDDPEIQQRGEQSSLQQALGHAINGTEAVMLDNQELTLSRRQLREELRPIRELLVGLRQDVNILADELRGIYFSNKS